MILAADIGNTNIVIAFFDEEKWSKQLRIETHKPSEKYALDFSNYLLENNFSMEAVSGIVVSSVVPHRTDDVLKVLNPIGKMSPLVLGPEYYTVLPVEITNPLEMGTDLVANALAAHVITREDCIVVDFGTALTFTVVSKSGKILGVSIAPGLKTAMKALTGNTAKLPEIPLKLPPSVMGGDTITAMQSGIMFGFTGLVEKMIHAIKAEVGNDMKVVATGGLSSILPGVKDLFDLINPNLTLDGLAIFHEVVTNGRVRS